MSGHYFCRDFMSVTIDGKFNFYNVKLNSTNKTGKFYMQTVKNRSRVFEVDEDLFKAMLVSASNIKNMGQENPTMANTFDYLLDQIEMNEDIFTALLYPDWINEYKEE